MGSKLTLEEFVASACLIHGNKYDYSKVVYINSKKKVIIICKIHGEFSQIPNSHLTGSGCPKCFNNTSRCLVDMSPRLLSEWHPIKNGDLTPETIIPLDVEVWWLCKNNHEWKEPIGKRRDKQTGCQLCRCLDVTHPELAKQWHLTKNGLLCSRDVTHGSNIVVWWQCPDNISHIWDTPICARFNKDKLLGCPYCSNHRVCLSNCLATTHSQLIAEWHPSKNNDLTPYDVTHGSDQIVWWQCPVEADHVYQQTPNTRIRWGCPYCRGLKVCLSNCLATTHSHLLKEWHRTKNIVTPYNVVAGSEKYAWWICDKGSDHEYKALISNRAKGSGCPCCEGVKVVPSNCLATTNPQLAAQWHPTKNGVLTPYGVTKGSGRKVWWLCDKGHEFPAAISNRSMIYAKNRGGCPICGESYGEKQTSLALLKRNVHFKREKRFGSCRNINPLPFDFLVYYNEQIALIEYQGIQHYEPVAFGRGNPEANLKKVRQHDSIKRKWCKVTNVPLLEIPYWEEDIDKLINEFLNSIIAKKLTGVA
jgi:hypothetical protein